MEKKVDPAPAPPKSPKEVFLEDVIRSLGVSDAVAEAFASVDRAEFAPEELKERAYSDAIIPLGRLSSISQPSLVALMIETLELTGDETVLEVGTATGYQASLLSFLAKEVHTIDIDQALSEQAAANVERLGYGNVTVHLGDGAKGIEGKVFDRIIITAAVREIPAALISQLADKGIIIAPVGEDMNISSMTVFTKNGDELVPHTNFACTFVPLVTETSAGWTEAEIAASRREKIAIYREQVREYLADIAAQNGLTYDVLMEKFAANLRYALGQDLSVTEEQAIDVINVVLSTFAKLESNKVEPDSAVE
jgi:protein-L-isoaspartate(D-aspartate) O-methyltransferase